jgi:hypothetical protein
MLQKGDLDFLTDQSKALGWVAADRATFAGFTNFNLIAHWPEVI